jgi:amino acid adenylation domain-containing protein
MGVTMPERFRLVDRVWRLDGELDLPALRARLRTAPVPVRLTVHDLTAAPEDGPEWGELVRSEVEAMRAEPVAARIALGRLRKGSSLVVVVTGAMPPRAVLDWLLVPGTPAPAESVVVAPPPARTEWPTTLRSGATTSHFAGTRRLDLGWRSVERARSMGVSVEALLASGVAVLLRRMQADVHSAIVGQERPVLVRLVVDEADSTHDLLRRTQKEIDRGIPVAADLSGTVTVAYRPTVLPEAVGAFRVTPVHVVDGTARHDLAVTATDDSLRVDYDTGLFDDETMTRFLDRLGAVLDDLLDDRRLWDVSGCTRAERVQLAGWSVGEYQPVPDTCLHTLIERHARRTPDAPAVECGNERLSYGRLDATANQIAHRLRRAGVDQGDLVAVLADRSVESIAAFLGVLKCGAGYVPVDPSYPADRIRYLIDDSGAQVVLARRDPEIALAATVLLLGDLDREPDTDPGLTVRPDQVAYVIYTSGSTGRPKGVAVHHRAIVISTHARAVGGPPPGRDLVTMALSFDGAAGGMYWALTNGGTVVLPTEAEVRDPLALNRRLRAAPVTHIHSVPSHYDLILRATEGHGLHKLRLASVGGEPMPARLVARHLLSCPDAILLNDYGPTECAVWATAHRCELADATGPAIPIGGPLPNYRVHVLDELLRPVPPGVPGEIYIGGPAVALGYHRRSALTAERFVPDPFHPAGRLYRTGDRGRWSVDGRLYVLGRLDNQVKVRGFRVELGEIEAEVRRHTGVADCVVLLESGAARAEQLVAFVTMTGGTPKSEARLRETVARTLPDYMCPQRFVVLPEIPRASSGKIDMLALRAMLAEP